MNVRNLLTLNAVLVALASLVAMLSPTTLLETNGLEITPHTINQMRAFGAVTTGYGITAWLLRDVGPSRARRAYLLGAGTSYLFFAAINVVNITGTPDLETNIGWVYFTLNMFLGAAFLLFGRREPEAAA